MDAEELCGLNLGRPRSDSCEQFSSLRLRHLNSSHVRTESDASRFSSPSVSQATARSSRAQLLLGRASANSPSQIHPNAELDTSAVVQPPHRSIFSSGPPTSCLSAESAQASMATSSNATTLLSLPNLNTYSNNHRNRANSTCWPHVYHTSEDQDHEDVDVSGLRSSRHLSDLFATCNDRPDALTRTSTQNNVVEKFRPASLADHLFSHGFVSGRHFDITIIAYGQHYKLHKLILDRAPFFSEALSDSWSGAASNEMTLEPQDMDENISQHAFETAIKRLYGTNVKLEDENEAINLFATASWLGLNDLVEQCIDFMISQFNVQNLSRYIQLVTENNYGSAGAQILSSAKAVLFKNGWEMPQTCWQGIPGDILSEVIGGDAFYVPSEWERWVLAARLFNARLRAVAIESDDISSVDDEPSSGSASLSTSLYQSPQITPLLDLLSERIHYVHLRFEQLQFIRSAKDILDNPFVPDAIISDALWKSMEMRQRIVNAQDIESELDLVVNENTPNGENKQFPIPNADISYVLGDDSEVVAQLAFTTNGDLQHQQTRADTSTTIASSTTSSRIYSTHPPFRFSVEFPNPRMLKERKKVYSQTVWYAGSLWNLYITRNGIGRSQQLGVYLHRARNKYDLEHMHLDNSTPDPRVNLHEHDLSSSRRFLSVRGNEEQYTFDSNRATFLDPITKNLTLNLNLKDLPADLEQKQKQPESPDDSSTDLDLFEQSIIRFNNRQANVSPTVPAYTDPRTTIKTYFKIYSPSQSGKQLNVYESRPDDFTWNKSWGWMSSQANANDDRRMDNSCSLSDSRDRDRRHDKLRYMVAIGNI